MLNRFSIKHRLYGVMGLLLILSVLGAYFVFNAASSVKKESLNQLDQIARGLEKEKLKAVTHSLAVALGNELAELDRETEQFSRLQQILNPIRFEADDSGYFYAYKGTVNVAHPIKPGIVGRDLGELKDANGVFPIRALEKAAAAGGGFCVFTWDKPGAGPTLKLGYAEMIPGTGIWVGTGLYMDNLLAFEARTVQVITNNIRSVLIRMGGAGGVVLLLIFAVCLSVVSGITSSISAMEKGVSHLRKGDFTRRIGLSGTDELSRLAGVFDHFTGKMNRAMGKVRNQSQAINQLSEDLNTLSGEMSEAAAMGSAEASEAAVEAREMTNYMTSVSGVMENTSQNIAQIAAATEEISATIKEITQNTEATAATTEKATREARDAALKMDELTSRTSEINSMTQIIEDISSQTHLLALNATIEASRAGAAGKGFAVVADEIKALANQTSSATEEIRDKVDGIQNTVARTRHDILAVEEVIRKANNSVTLVQTAVLEQARSTEEINATLHETSSNIGATSANMARARQMTEDITQKISQLFSSSSQIAGDSRLVNECADELNCTSENFARISDGFTTSRAGFNAGPVKRAHNAWRKKLSDMLSGKTSLDPSDIHDHRSCAFGNWYFNEGKSLYGSLETFEAINEKHEAVHTTARRIAVLALEGNKKEAEALYSQFRQTSQSLFGLLEQLEAETSAP